MSTLFDRIGEATAHLRSRWSGTPRVGIILGTGLGDLADEIENATPFDYSEIPHFPTSTVTSHAGKLHCGTFGGQSAMVMQGRFHFYEGYSMQQITFPVRVMAAMGCEILLVTNAAGGLNPQHSKGDIMLIEDHVNLMGDNPLIGPNDDRLGDRFPDMCYPYDRDLLALARRVALREGIAVQQGVFVALSGPCLETRAEYRFLRQIGADAVGMSTVPEAIVGVHAKLRILGMSAITDMCLADALQPVSLPEIIEVAHATGAKMRTLVRKVLEELPG